jgi:hypothetical protein
MSSRWGSTPRLTDCLTISRNVTLTSFLVSSGQSPAGKNVGMEAEDIVENRNQAKAGEDTTD